MLLVAIIVAAAGLSVYIAEDHPQTSTSTIGTSSSKTISSSASSYTSSIISPQISSSSNSSTISAKSVTTTSTSQTSTTNSSSLSNSSSAPQWQMFQYDVGDTGQSPYPGPHNATLLWEHDYGVGGAPLTSPVIGSDGTIYVPFSNLTGLLAIRPNGSIEWRMNFCCSIGNKVAIGSGGNIYATDGGSLLSISSAGSVLWNTTTNLGNSSYPLQLVGIGSTGSIYTEDANGSRASGGLDAFSSNGTITWRFSNSTSQLNVFTQDFSFRAFAIGPDGTIYLPFYNLAESTYGLTWMTNIYAINPNGSLKWIS